MVFPKKKQNYLSKKKRGCACVRAQTLSEHVEHRETIKGADKIYGKWKSIFRFFSVAVRAVVVVQK